MKLKKLEINNFKGLKHFEMDLTERGDKARFLTCIVGDNGSGKTTVLQAIALVLSLATNKIASLSAFQWNGFVPQSALSRRSSFKLELEMDDDESSASKELVEQFNAAKKLDKIQSIAHSKNITLLYENYRLSCLEGRDALAQLEGRFYLKKLFKETQVNIAPYFSRVGDIFWFDQYRNMGNNIHDNFEDISWKDGIASIRDALSRWWMYHRLEEEEKTGRDYLSELEQKLDVIFPDTHFVGGKPIKIVVNDSFSEDFMFLIRRNGKRYDISEMSSGEQSIFTLLYQFVRLEIARSIVLIDELELHLHPQKQQAIYAYLRKLSPDSQFIFTTHSSYLEDVLFEDEIVRMQGES